MSWFTDGIKGALQQAKSAADMIVAKAEEWDADNSRDVQDGEEYTPPDDETQELGSEDDKQITSAKDALMVGASGLFEGFSSISKKIKTSDLTQKVVSSAQEVVIAASQTIVSPNDEVSDSEERPILVSESQDASAKDPELHAALFNSQTGATKTQVNTDAGSASAVQNTTAMVSNNRVKSLEDEIARLRGVLLGIRQDADNEKKIAQDLRNHLKVYDEKLVAQREKHEEQLEDMRMESRNAYDTLLERFRLAKEELAEALSSKEDALERSEALTVTLDLEKQRVKALQAELAKLGSSGDPNREKEMENWEQLQSLQATLDDAIAERDLLRMKLDSLESTGGKQESALQEELFSLQGKVEKLLEENRIFKDTLAIAETANAEKRDEQDALATEEVLVLKSEVVTLREQLVALENASTALQSEKKVLETQIAALESNTVDLNGQVDSISSSLADKDDEILQLRQSLADLSAQLDNERKKSSDFDKINLDLEATIETLRKEKSSLEEKVVDLTSTLQENSSVNDEIITLRSTYDAQIEALQEKLKELDGVKRHFSDMHEEHAKLSVQYNEAVTAKAQLEEELSQLQTSQTTWKEQKERLASFEVENQSLKEAHAAHEALIQELRDTSQALSNELMEIRLKLETKDSELEDLCSKVSHLEDEKAVLKETVEANTGLLEDAKAQNRTLEERLREQKIAFDSLNDTHVASLQELTNLKSELVETKEVHEKILVQYEEAQQQETALREQLSSLRAGIDNADQALQESIVTMEKEMADLRAQLAEARKNEVVSEKKLRKLQAKLEKKNEEILVVQESLNKFKRDMQDKEELHVDAVQALKDKCAGYETELVDVKKQLEETSRSLSESQADSESNRTNLENHIATLEEEKLSFRMERDNLTEQLRVAEERLQGTIQDRSTIAEDLVKEQSVRTQLESELSEAQAKYELSVQDYEVKLRALQEEYHTKLGSNDGQLEDLSTANAQLHHQVATLQGELEKLQQVFESTEQQLRTEIAEAMETATTLGISLQDKEAETVKLTKGIEESREQVVCFEEKVAQLEAELSETRAQFSNEMEKLGFQGTEVEKYRNELLLREEAIAALTTDKQELEEQYRAEKQRHEESLAGLRQLEEELAKNAEELSTLKEQNARLDEQLLQSTESYSSLQESYKAAMQKANALDATLQESSTELASRSQQLEARVAELEAELKQTRETLLQVQEQLERKEQAYESLQNDFRVTLQEAKQDRAEADELRASLQSVSREAAEVTSELSTVRDECALLRKKQERLETELEQANLKLQQTRSHDANAQAHISDLEAQLMLVTDSYEQAKIDWTARESQLTATLNALESQLQRSSEDSQALLQVRHDLELRESDLAQLQEAMANIRSVNETILKDKEDALVQLRSLTTELAEFAKEKEQLQATIEQLKSHSAQSKTTGASMEAASESSNLLPPTTFSGVRPDTSVSENDPPEVQLSHAQIRISQLQQQIHSLRTALDAAKASAYGEADGQVDKRILAQLLLTYFTLQRIGGLCVGFTSIKAKDSLTIAANILELSPKDKSAIGLDDAVISGVDAVTGQAVSSAVRQVGGFLSGWIGGGSDSSASRPSSSTADGSFRNAFVEFLLAETADERDDKSGSAGSAPAEEEAPLPSLFSSPITARKGR